MVIAIEAEILRWYEDIRYIDYEGVQCRVQAFWCLNYLERALSKYV